MGAAMPHFRDAGEKLLEVKRQLPHGQFTPWLDENLTVSRKQANLWMRWAAQKEPAGSFSSLAEFARQTKKIRTLPTDPPQPLLPTGDPIEVETVGLARDVGDQTRAAERDLELLIIATGFKALRRKHHPHSAGITEELSKLIEARRRLEQKV